MKFSDSLIKLGIDDYLDFIECIYNNLKSEYLVMFYWQQNIKILNVLSGSNINDHSYNMNHDADTFNTDNNYPDIVCINDHNGVLAMMSSEYINE